MLRWWRRRKDREVMAWLLTPEGREYLQTHGGGGDGAGEVQGALGVSVIGVMMEEIDQESEYRE